MAYYNTSNTEETLFQMFRCYCGAEYSTIAFGPKIQEIWDYGNVKMTIPSPVEFRLSALCKEGHRETRIVTEREMAEYQPQPKQTTLKPTEPEIVSHAEYRRAFGEEDDE